MTQQSRLQARDTRPVDSTDAAAAVHALVETLELLEARIHRDLNAETREASEVADPAWAETLREFTAYAEDCMRVLDDERVITALGQQVPRK
jgi:hypothetical protein